MTVPDLLSASAAGTMPRLDGSGGPLTNSPTMGVGSRAGRPRELKNEKKPTAAAWRACSPAQAQRRRRPKRPLAAIRPESRAGRHMAVPAGRGGALLRERQVVRFEHVGLRYGLGPEVLRDLTFRIDERSFQFLTGPSGAGKTSLLRLLFLSLRPTRGLVTLFGHDIATLSKDALATLRRRIGIVLQDFRLLDHMTTYENVALPFRVIGREESSYRKEVIDLLKWVGLGERMDALPPILSGGEKQRAAIARA